jgi:NitT/TauT family transport system ATP-binding protein
LIEVLGLSHQFEREDGADVALDVLDDVSFTIEKGTFVSFVGPSGCGKTTLLRIIDGLIRPSRGEVLIDGETVCGPSATRAMVFQEFNLLPWRTVLRNIELGLEVQGADRRERRKVAFEILKRVGLEGFEHYYPHQLSGGMKQRVGLARALSISPTYLFMDEPFGALDPQIRELMQLELLKLLDAHQKTVVFVTHSVDEAIFLSDRILVFTARPGRILSSIDIELPRPRWKDDETVKSSETFVDYRQHIWHLLKQELQSEWQLQTAPRPDSRPRPLARRRRLS